MIVRFSIQISTLILCRYFVLSIVDGKIDVEKIGELDATYEDFLTDIKKMDGDKKDCRFAGKECSDKPNL